MTAQAQMNHNVCLSGTHDLPVNHELNRSHQLQLDGFDGLFDKQRQIQLERPLRNDYQSMMVAMIAAWAM